MYTAFAENRSKIPSTRPLNPALPSNGNLPGSDVLLSTPSFALALAGGFYPGQGAIVRLKLEEAAGREVRVLIIVDDRGPLQQELVHIGLDGQHIPWDELCPMVKGFLWLLRSMRVPLFGLLKDVIFRIQQISDYKPDRKSYKFDLSYNQKDNKNLSLTLDIILNFIINSN